MPKVTDRLTAEHKNILRVIDGLLNQCAKDEKAGAFDADFYRAAIDFIRNYADKFHHAKEEDILFIELNKDSANLHCNPTEQMIYEHDLGRQCVKELQAGLDKNDLKKILAGARGYGDLLKDHIFKEDNILYPMADEALSDEIKDDMLVKFEKIGRECAAANKKYELFLNNIMAKPINAEKKIKEAIEQIRPSLLMDGGDVHFVNFDEPSGVLKVELTGQCAHCPMSSVTLKQGIEAEIMKSVPQVKEVRAVQM